MKLHWTLFGLTLAAGAALRFLGLGADGLWHDESWSWWLATGDLIGKLRAVDAHPPLYYATLSLWIRLGDSEAWIRALSALYGVATLPLVYRLGKKVAGNGLLPMAILAFSPFHVFFSQEARSYSILFLEATLLLNLLVDLRERDRLWQWIGVAVLTASMPYTHYMGVFFLFAVAIVVAIWCRGRAGMAKGALLALGGSVVLFLPWLLTAIQHTLMIKKGFWIPFPDHRIVGRSLGELAVSPVSFGAPWHYAWAVPLWLAALAAPWIARERRHAVWLIPMVIPIVAEWAVSWIRPIYYTRTLMFVLLPFSLLLTIAVSRLPERRRWMAAALLLGVSIPGLIAIRTGLHKEDWRSCTEIVSCGISPGEIVIVHPEYLNRNVGYYWRTGKPGPIWTASAAGDSWTQGGFPELLERVKRGDVQGVWLVRRPLEGTEAQSIPGEFDAIFPRRYRYVARNTEVIWWAR